MSAEQRREAFPWVSRRPSWAWPTGSQDMVPSVEESARKQTSTTTPATGSHWEWAEGTATGDGFRPC